MASPVKHEEAMTRKPHEPRGREFPSARAAAGAVVERSAGSTEYNPRKHAWRELVETRVQNRVRAGARANNELIK